MTMRRIKLAALAGALITTACAIGGNANHWAVAKGPEGAWVEVTVGSRRIDAELIEVGDEGVVLKQHDGKLAFAPYASIQQLIAPRLGSAYKACCRIPPSRDAKAKLQIVSHFPHGLVPAIRAKLLEQSGQTSFLGLQ
jgi:hypothetical protein